MAQLDIKIPMPEEHRRIVALSKAVDSLIPGAHERSILARAERFEFYIMNGLEETREGSDDGESRKHYVAYTPPCDSYLQINETNIPCDSRGEHDRPHYNRKHEAVWR